MRVALILIVCFTLMGFTHPLEDRFTITACVPSASRAYYDVLSQDPEVCCRFNFVLSSESGDGEFTVSKNGCVLGTVYGGLSKQFMLELLPVWEVAYYDIVGHKAEAIGKR